MPDNLSAYIKNASKEDKKANATKAGKKSGEARREKRLLKEYLAAILENKSEAGNLYDEITIALITKALEGDVHAYEVIRDTLGQKEADKLEMNSNTVKITIGGEENE